MHHSTVINQKPTMMSLWFFCVSVVRTEMIKNIKHILKMNRSNHTAILSKQKRSGTSSSLQNRDKH